MERDALSARDSAASRYTSMRRSVIAALVLLAFTIPFPRGAQKYGNTLFCDAADFGLMIAGNQQTKNLKLSAVIAISATRKLLLETPRSRVVNSLEPKCYLAPIHSSVVATGELGSQRAARSG